MSNLYDHGNLSIKTNLKCLTISSLIRDGTVTGELEGEQARVIEMRSWLETKGSPQSRIDRAEFRNVRQITKFSFENFKIIR